MKKLVFVFSLLLVISLSHLVIAQPDSLSDVFPLKEGLSWTYDFKYVYSNIAVHYTQVDTGIVKYSIISNKIAHNSITWNFKQERECQRSTYYGGSWTVEYLKDTSFFDIVEMLQYEHELFMVTENVYRAFLFFADAPDSEKFYRYIYTDSTGRAILDMNPDPYQFDYVRYLVSKDTGIISSKSEKRDYTSIRSTDYYLTQVVTAIDLINELPSHLTLSQNYPNPFNPSTKINYQIPQSGFISLKVYDLLGREIATLVNEEKPAGSYNVEFPSVETHRNASLPSGVYLYRLQAGEFVETKKMILLK